MAPNFGLANPASVDLTNMTEDKMRAITCYMYNGSNDYDGQLGARISSIFVILVTSLATTTFPVGAVKQKKVKIPLPVYLFARYFGAGVIIATAFIHLLDPAYTEIGPATCVGLTAGWRGYSWPPALALSSAMLTFLLGFAGERYVEKKFNLRHGPSEDSNEDARLRTGSVDAAAMTYATSNSISVHGHQGLHSADQDGAQSIPMSSMATKDQHSSDSEEKGEVDSIDAEKERLADIAFNQQIAAFLVLEFGVIFHSVIIGLTLGTAGAAFATLYPVIIFHQAFEGMGVGARLSAIPFPRKLRFMPWLLCIAYGVTTPIAIAIALGIRTTYNGGSFTANVVSGVLDSISAGILLYTGFVELLARDFLFNPNRTDNSRLLAFMLFCVFLGAGIMALLGKWA